MYALENIKQTSFNGKKGGKYGKYYKGLLGGKNEVIFSVSAEEPQEDYFCFFVDILSINGFNVCSGGNGMVRFFGRDNEEFGFFKSYKEAISIISNCTCLSIRVIEY